MKRIRIAVVGAGHLGRIHARLLKTIDGVELVGVVDPIEQAREQVAIEAETASFTDIDAVVGSIDAAVIAAPTCHHFELAAELLEANIHLLVEKPLAATAEQARQLVRLAREKRRILQVGHVERFNPAWNAVRGTLGRLLHIDARRECRHTFRSTDIGVVLDLMIHDIDLILSLVRSELTDVRAFGFSSLGQQEDTASAWLTFANGVQAHLSASRVAHGQQRTMRISTDQSWAELDFAGGTARVVRPGHELKEHSATLGGLNAEQRKHLQTDLFSTLLEGTDLPVEAGNAILDEQHDFVISIRSRRAPIVSGEAGVAALEVAERILAAMQPNTWHTPHSATTRSSHPASLPLPARAAKKRRAG